ncbi:MAG: lactate racemase domain-containing protein [Desulfobacterales bacterium]|nr:lactate racemase domain-containing protein [Desulfobacterales bacterium]
MAPSKPAKYPCSAFVRQQLTCSPVKDIPDSVTAALSSLFSRNFKHGETVAVAVGSRGIDKINFVVYHCVRYLEKMGLKPFIIPAMGSHGGATAEGQRKVLEKLGIAGSEIGVPVFPDMETESIGKLPCGLNIHISKRALLADHVVVINRIKPHTKFRAEIESGLSKMLTIGLGKAEGAAAFHNFAVRHGFGIIEEAAGIVLKNIRLLFGLALLEDGYGNLSKIEAVPPSALIGREKELLKDARKMIGSIPFDSLDLLIVDLFGKDISGIGMDSNITGRHRDIVGDFYVSPHAKRIFVRDLSPGSDGNGNGIGLADITTTRLVNSLDMEKTYANAIAAISPEKAAIPVHFDTDRKCLDACAKTLGLDSMKNARVVRIKSTKSLEHIQVSKALEPEIESNQDIKRVSPWEPFKFDENDNLLPFPSPDFFLVNGANFL